LFVSFFVVGGGREVREEGREVREEEERYAPRSLKPPISLEGQQVLVRWD
jgi:hypothetical protein